MLFARRRHGNFNVLAECRQEIDQSANGEVACPVAGKRRNVRLLNAKDLRRFYLGQTAIFNDPGDLECQPGFGEFLLCIRQAEIDEHVSATFHNIVSLDGLPSP